MSKRSILWVISAITLLLFPFRQSNAQKSFKEWPLGTDPAAIGLYVAKHFVATPHTNFGAPTPPGSITYPEVCTWYGALQLARATANKELAGQLETRFTPFFTTEEKLVPKPDHVDHNVFGAIPLELYKQTRKSEYLESGKFFADKQWQLPENANEEQKKWSDQGLSWQTRLWIDDMFMITLVQAQAFRATGNRQYIDRAAKEMIVYLDGIQQPNGLFYHAPDVPFFWGRGNGWMAAGMAELLSALPEDNPDKARIMTAYKTMMASLKQFQTSSGMWRQLVDNDQSWPETSATGMFTYAMIIGVKKGWLDEKEYGTVAREGWLALVPYINAEGDITDVCEGTNKKNDKQYYLDRKRLTGDLHGQAPVLWCAYALVSKD